ncbi:MAG: serine/threonine-protein kinase [Byssovorax sp.]
MIGAPLDQKYQLTRLLGEGAMGSVYEALHQRTGRRVAVKLIRSDNLALGPERDRASRFRREARAAGSIESPHIVQVLDSGEDAATGTLYLVMERLVGEDLQRLLDRVGALPLRVGLCLAGQALLGLEKAHAAGIVHRDIKPANLFLARQDSGEIVVKILDFGIAKVRVDPLDTSATAGITGTGGFLGSPLYMSPEQVHDSREVDHRADLWSLGSALYCALTGSAPHQEIASIGRLILAICSSPATPIQERAEGISPEVAAVVHRALSISRDERWSDATAMLEAIRALAPAGFTLREEMLVGTGEPPPGAHPAIKLVTTEPVSSAGDKLPFETTVKDSRPAPAPSPPPPRHWKLWMVAANLAAFAVVVAYLAHTNRSTSPIRHVHLPVTGNSVAKVDGRVEPVNDGEIEISGSNGSVHEVRIYTGSRERRVEVILTDDGPRTREIGITPLPSTGNVPEL